MTADSRSQKMLLAASALSGQMVEFEAAPIKSGFLSRGAARSKLIEAAAVNHTEWFAAFAAAAGGEIHRVNGVRWTMAPAGAAIPFPRLPEALASETLDAILAECRRQMPSCVFCWSRSSSRARRLGVRLMARGFEWGWRPHWMALDLRNIPDNSSLPKDLRIAVDDSAVWDVDELPLYHRENAAALQALARANPRQTWHFGAWLNGKVVAHSLLFVTTGSLGAAGIYDVGVTPSAQRRGIGKAITLAACQAGRALGCHYALLNSAADGLYERLGFESLGFGQTWWMHRSTLALPPNRAEIAFAEAIGQGDIAALDALDCDSLPREMDAPLPGGTTPLAMAVRFSKPESAAWLESHGASIDLVHAWLLGWKARVRQMLHDCPELVNRRSGDWLTTPLHEAVERDDIALVRLLLTAHPDLSIEDAQFHSTPLGWARHLERTRIKALLERYQGHA